MPRLSNIVRITEEGTSYYTGNPADVIISKITLHDKTSKKKAMVSLYNKIMKRQGGITSLFTN